MSLRIRGKRPIRRVALMLCLFITLSCGAVDDAVASLNRAIDTLDRNSSAWMQTLQDLERDLIAQGRTTIANDVKNLLDGSIASVGDEFRCNVDFIGLRVDRELRNIRAALLNQARSQPDPRMCKAVPESLNLGLVILPGGGVTTVAFHGYDLRVQDGLKVFVLDPRGEHEVDAAMVANPSPYVVTVNVSITNGVRLASDAQKLVMRYRGGFVSDILIIAAPPPAPALVRNLRIAFHTNNEDKDDDTGVQVEVLRVAEWHQQAKEKYPDNSDFMKVFSPSTVKLADLQGNTLRICISPNGNDTWRFNYSLLGDRQASGDYVYTNQNISLTQDSRCHSARLP
jgi:hypothetical protein